MTPAASKVRLSIHDADGRLVRTIEGVSSSSGAGAIVWDGLGPTGRRVPPGVYWCRLDVDGLRTVVKIVRMDH